jgi:hypothetical protein
MRLNASNLLAFTSAYFSESGLFKGLRSIQIKNSLLSVPAGVSLLLPVIILAPDGSRRAALIQRLKMYTTSFWICQVNVRPRQFHSVELTRPTTLGEDPGLRFQRRRPLRSPVAEYDRPGPIWDTDVTTRTNPGVELAGDRCLRTKLSQKRDLYRDGFLSLLLDVSGLVARWVRETVNVILKCCSISV